MTSQRRAVIEAIQESKTRLDAVSFAAGARNSRVPSSTGSTRRFPGALALQSVPVGWRSAADAGPAGAVNRRRGMRKPRQHFSC
jgi:hypothetical protein